MYIDRIGAMKGGFTRQAALLRNTEFGTLTNTLTRQAAMGMTPGANAFAMATGDSVMRMAMKPFSPLYQESNLMLPKDRRTTNAYNRHYYETDYWVGNAIDLHTYYPLGGFRIISKYKDIEQFFTNMAERMNLMDLILGVGSDFWIYGEAFPYLHWDKQNKMWGSGIVYNPDFVDVTKSAFGTNAVISLIPDAELKRIVTSNHPKDMAVRDQIPYTILEYVLKGENIPMNNRAITHILKKSVPHDVRGTSIIQRVWKELMLRDALREVLFVIAQNHITPLKLFKIGGKEKGYLPPEEDLMYWRDVIMEAQNDPNFSLITHDAFEVQYVGATGQIVDVTQYYRIIEDNVLTGLFISKAMTSGDGPCVIAGTEVMTRNGWKIIDECTTADEVASINPETGSLEYCYPKEKFEFEVTGPMHHFEHQHLDHCVTPNHRCWARLEESDKYEIVIASEMGDKRYRFKSIADEWNGELRTAIQIPGYSDKIETNTFLKFAGLYLSEGSIEYSPKGSPDGVRITQTRQHKNGINPRFDRVKNGVLSAFSTAIERNYVDGEEKHRGRFEINNVAIAQYMHDEFGAGAENKRIPLWVKNLDRTHLLSLLEGCYLGDGSDLGNSDNTDSYEIYTISKQQADDLQEIAFKCGVASTITFRDRDESRQRIYRVKFYIKGAGERQRGAEPTVRPENTKIIQYTGKVYSFDLPPNRIYVTRRNGKITITGNTYANAVVAYEVLQKRYVFFRNIIEKWLLNKVFYPVSIANKFIDPVTKKYIVPQIRWNRIDFNKDDQWKNMLMQMNSAQNKLISDRTLVTEIGLDYEEEQQLIRLEKQQAKARRNMMKEQGGGAEAGAGGAMGGGMGGLGGGLPPLGGGGGGLPPMPPMPELGGGGLPGGEPGAPAPGGMGAGMEVPPPGGTPAPAGM